MYNIAVYVIFSVATRIGMTNTEFVECDIKFLINVWARSCTYKLIVPAERCGNIRQNRNVAIVYQ